MKFFAVEIRESESNRAVVERVIRVAHALRIPFGRIDVLNQFSLGTVKFLRFAVPDKGLTAETLVKLLDRIYGDGRSVVKPEGGGFTACLPKRFGTCPTMTMLSTSPAKVTYRGPGADYWERQFAN